MVCRITTCASVNAIGDTIRLFKIFTVPLQALTEAQVVILYIFRVDIVTPRVMSEKFCAIWGDLRAEHFFGRTETLINNYHHADVVKISVNVRIQLLLASFNSRGYTLTRRVSAPMT